MMILALVLTASPCFDAVDPSSGWKKVRLTAQAPSLQAPPGLSQFRSNERVSMTEQLSGLYRAGTTDNGRTDFELDLGAGAQTVTLEFKESLRGAKVDVTSWGVTMLHEERVRGSTLTFNLGSSGTTRVWVRVHNHLRETPVLMGVRIDRTLWPRELGLPETYSGGDALYYYQPEPQMTVRLCDTPNGKLQVSRESLEHAASKPVSVDPLPRSTQ